MAKGIDAIASAPSQPQSLFAINGNSTKSKNFSLFSLNQLLTVWSSPDTINLAFDRSVKSSIHRKRGTDMNTKQKMIGWFLVGLVALIMLASGSAKIFGFMPEQQMKEMGPIANQIVFIGFGCLASGILLLIPRLASIGLILCSSYWGGAICTHLATETPFVVPAALLAITWIGTYLRDPRMLWSFTNP